MRENNQEFWNSRRGKIAGFSGGWKIGEGVFCHGYSMMEEFVGRKSYMQVLVLNATGKLVSKALSDWFEAVFICLSWPDPRIWCNHIGALGGTVKNSVVAATAAGVMAADSRTYGSRPIMEGMEFITNAYQAFARGQSAEEIVAAALKKTRGKPGFMGYARPISKGDERVEAMEPFTGELGFEVGPHLRLAYSIEKILMRDFNEGMNINGYVSAFCSDQGFSAREMYRVFAIVVNSGVLACYVDAEKQPAGSFLPLKCTDIDYQGRPKRAL